jgi:hypothetical protein
VADLRPVRLIGIRPGADDPPARGRVGPRAVTRRDPPAGQVGGLGHRLRHGPSHTTEPSADQRGRRALPHHPLCPASSPRRRPFPLPLRRRSRTTAASANIPA